MARNNGVSSTTSGQQGLAVRTRAAKGPAGASSRALDGASSSRKTALWPKSSTAWDAERCQLRVGSRDGSSSAGTGGAYPRSAQPQSILGVPNGSLATFLQRVCSAARKTGEGGRETLHFLCNNSFRVGMLEAFFFVRAIFSDLRRGPCAVNTACTVALVEALPAGRDGELPAHVGQDFVKLGRFPCDVALPCQRELQQRGREGAVQCNCTRDLRGLCCGPDGRGGGGCPVAREQAQPGGGFGSESAPDFNPNDHQAAATGAHKKACTYPFLKIRGLSFHKGLCDPEWPTTFLGHIRLSRPFCENQRCNIRPRN